MHWDQEPTGFPLTRPTYPLSPTGGEGVRFMESPHGFTAVHWDHEPFRIPLTRPSDTLSPSGGEGWGEGVPRFMESPHDFCAVHWDVGPNQIPLNRPSGTFSPTGGEGRDEGIRFMDSCWWRVGSRCQRPTRRAALPLRCNPPPATRMSIPFTEIAGQKLDSEQVAYLEGLFAGLKNRGLSFSDAAANPIVHSNGAQRNLDGLIFEERVKRELHPLDAYPLLLEHAAASKAPDKENVFRFKWHGLFYLAPNRQGFMCRLRIPAG